MPYKKYQEWRISNAEVFWGEIAPRQHLLQIYENESVFISTLEGFIKNGFDSGESVVVIATGSHLNTLHVRLQFSGYDIESLKSRNLYIPVDAYLALEKFMVNNWPDEAQFTRFVSSPIEKAREGGRKVRAFGEMVAVLWNKGLSGATIHLEHLWERYLHQEPINLFCAYPKSGFTKDPHLSLQDICACNSLIISGDSRPSAEIFYHNSLSYPKEAIS